MLKKFHDLTYGDVSLYRHKQSEELYAVASEVVQNSTDYDSLLKYLERVKNLNHANLPDMLGWSFYNANKFCGPDYLVFYLFQYYETSLADEINTRQIDRRYFEEKELWYMLFALTNVCTFLD